LEHRRDPYATKSGQLRKIAHLYYTENIGQREIATRMNISIATVSRSLETAKKLGIVTIIIQPETDDYSALEIELERRFSLRECLLVADSQPPEATYERMSVALADLLGRLLKRGGTLGVSWGETLKSMGEHLGRVWVDPVDVVPIIGAMGKIETGIYPNSIARAFAEKLGGSAYLVNTPAIVDSPEIRRSLMKDSNFQAILDRWRHLDAAILGVSDLNTDSSMCRGGIFSPDELRRIAQDGGTCASNFIFFNQDGTIVETALSERIVCLPAPDLRRIPTIVIAAAGANKTAPLRAILKSGLCHALVSDVASARSILERD